MSKKAFKPSDYIGKVFNGEKIIKMYKNYGVWYVDVELKDGKVIPGRKLCDVRNNIPEEKKAARKNIKTTDLKPGYIIFTKSGEKFIYATNRNLVSLSSGEAVDIKHFDENTLKHIYQPSADIAEVYDDITCENLFWKRKIYKLLKSEIEILKAAKVLDFRYISKDVRGLVILSKNRPFSKGAECYKYNVNEPQLCKLDIRGFSFIKYDIASEQDDYYSISDLLCNDETLYEADEQQQTAEQ